eukprot:TRINITY_DN1018_c4_g1_i2.p1 TRINITY_DN1018_c4_g1~~TRINITY_DN1018_c4_g1_i2.p1  ORF type:complete len:675 (+),score=177.08 TRINITY_DN1018_c4_g1_i2:68-2026(+)
MSKRKHKASASSPGAAASGFIGFSSGRQALTSKAVPADGVSQDVLLAFKKAGKKDPRTKLKAIAELLLLFEEKEKDDLVAALPLFVPIFVRLASDNDRRVRSGACDTIAALAQRVKKELAPHLKKIIGQWLACKFDPAFEVRSSAEASFGAAFSAAKYGEALRFCCDDLIKFSVRGLASTVSSVQEAEKTLSDAEAEERVVRCHANALSIIAHVLEHVDVSEHAKLQSQLWKILGKDGEEGDGDAGDEAQKKQRKKKKAKREVSPFWRLYLGNSAAVVRCAAYNLVTSLCENFPSAIEGNLAGVSEAVLGAFSDKDTLCHSPMWKAILTLVHVYGSAWKYIHMGVFMPRISAFLRNGCYGSAKASAPCVVPLLANLASNSQEPQLENVVKILCEAPAMMEVVSCPPSAVVAMLRDAVLYFTAAAHSENTAPDVDGDAFETLDRLVFLPLRCLDTKRGQRISASSVANLYADLVGKLLERADAHSHALVGRLLNGLGERVESACNAESDQVPPDTDGAAAGAEECGRLAVALQEVLAGVGAKLSALCLSRFAPFHVMVDYLVVTAHKAALRAHSPVSVTLLSSCARMYPICPAGDVPECIRSASLQKWFERELQVCHDPKRLPAIACLWMERAFAEAATGGGGGGGGTARARS